MQYQNIFTQVQVRGPVEAGIPLPRGDDERVGTPFYNWLAGWFGNAQIGPVYLGFLGTASLIAGTIWFVIVGFNMLASVGWDPIQFIRQLFWLALEPPPAKYGLSIVPPLNEGGWYIISSVFLLAAVLLWWIQDLCPGTGARPRHPCLLGLRRGDLAVPGARSVPSHSDGQLGRGRALRHLPAS
jgi:photosynthetic reaction center M subunit